MSHFYRKMNAYLCRLKQTDIILWNHEPIFERQTVYVV